MEVVPQEKGSGIKLLVFVALFLGGSPVSAFSKETVSVYEVKATTLDYTNMLTVKTCVRQEAGGC